MVRYYREQLELSGFVIDSFKGPNGGYFMDKNHSFNIQYFNKYDLDILDTVEENMKCDDPEIKEKFEKLSRKLRSIYNINKITSEYKEFDVCVRDMDEKTRLLQECVREKKKIHIDYLGSDGKITKRDIVPLGFFDFENAIYVTAFCRLRGDIRHFNITKILDYKVGR